MSQVPSVWPNADSHMDPAVWLMKAHTILGYAAQDIATLIVLAATAAILWYTARETKKSGEAL